MSEDLATRVGSRIGTRLMDYIKAEMSKKETIAKITVIKDTVILHLIKAIHPYIITIILVMILILLLQGYLVAKLIYVHNELMHFRM
jgi:hypothetical protein